MLKNHIVETQDNSDDDGNNDGGDNPKIDINVPYVKSKLR